MDNDYKGLKRDKEGIVDQVPKPEGFSLLVAPKRLYLCLIYVKQLKLIWRTRLLSIIKRLNEII